MPIAKTKLVVIKPGALGDTLLMAPALRALRQSFPALGITVVGTMPAVGLLELFGVADEVIAIDRLNLYAPAEAEYKVLNGARVLAFVLLEERVRVSLQDIAGAAAITSHPSRARHPVEHTAVYLHRCLRGSIPETGDLSPAPFRYPRHRQTAVKAPYAILAPGAGNAAKRAPMAVFVKAAQDMAKRGANPVFIGGEVERAQGLVHHYPDQYQCCLNPALEDLAVLLQRAEAVFANDSGPAHLAGLLGAATTVFFGPTDPDVWRPWGPGVTIRRFQ